MNQLSKPSRLVLNVSLILALLAGLYFLKAFLGVIALAAITTVIFLPLHQWLSARKSLGRAFATGFTLVIALLSFVLPLVIVITASLYQVTTALHDFQNANFLQGKTTSQIIDETVDAGNNIAKQVPFFSGVTFTRSEVINKVRTLAQSAASAALGFITKTSASALTFLTAAVMYVIVFATMLARHEQLLMWLHRLSPFRHDITDQYLRRIKAMTVAMVKGTLLISIINGAIGALAFWLIGIPYPIFWFMLLTLLSFIPLGAGVIVFPVAFIELFTGHIWQGIFLLGVQMLIMNNTDNILRPLIVKDDSAMIPALILLSAFAGVGFFGLLGVIYGPIIMIVITTTLEMYDKYAETGVPLREAGRIAD